MVWGYRFLPAYFKYQLYTLSSIRYNDCSKFNQKAVKGIMGEEMNCEFE